MRWLVVGCRQAGRRRLGNGGRWEVGPGKAGAWRGRHARPGAGVGLGRLRQKLGGPERKAEGPGRRGGGGLG